MTLSMTKEEIDGEEFQPLSRITVKAKIIPKELSASEIDLNVEVKNGMTLERLI